MCPQHPSGIRTAPPPPSLGLSSTLKPQESPQALNPAQCQARRVRVGGRKGRRKERAFTVWHLGPFLRKVNMSVTTQHGAEHNERKMLFQQHLRTQPCSDHGGGGLWGCATGESAWGSDLFWQGLVGHL